MASQCHQSKGQTTRIENKMQTSVRQADLYECFIYQSVNFENNHYYVLDFEPFLWNL